MSARSSGGEQARRHAEEALRTHRVRPGRDGGRKGRLEEGPSHQRGIEQVLTEAAPDELSESDAADTAEERDPQGDLRRQRESQQQARQQRAVVAQRGGDGGSAEEPLRDHRAGGRRAHDQQRTDPEGPARDPQHHQRRGHHLEHDAGRGRRLPREGGRGKHQIGRSRGHARGPPRRVPPRSRAGPPFTPPPCDGGAGPCRDASTGPAESATGTRRSRRRTRSSPAGGAPPDRPVVRPAPAGPDVWD